MINILPKNDAGKNSNCLHTYCRFRERVKRSNERLAREVLADLYLSSRGGACARSGPRFGPPYNDLWH
jgi:hypothetical protein